MASDSTVRPWLAAALTVLVTGLGHLYLRQWFRALAWFLLIVLTGTLFVPESVLESPMSAEIEEVAPVLLVALLAVVDAYLQARRHNAQVAMDNAERCAYCGRATDPELSFCQWCTTPRAPDGPVEGAE